MDRYSVLPPSLRRCIVEHPADASSQSDSSPSAGLGRCVVFVLAAASGITVANLYYNQPLLGQMASGFHVLVRRIGLIPTLTQVGYATGLLFLIPLGDVVSRRRLVVVLLAGVTLSLIAAALSPGLGLLALSSFAIGVTTVVPQVLIPFAARLTPAGQRGRTIGAIMSGVLIGILLSRTLSGIIGQHFGWRSVFWIATALMVVMAGVLALILPAGRPGPHIPYPKLLGSLFTLFRREPVLRQASLNGALMFGCFSAFWATLVFHLQSPPYHLGAQAAGLFGLVGAAGALVAPLAGRFADRTTPRTIVGFATALMLISFLVLWQLGSMLWGLCLGVVLLDIAAQAALISNQTRIYSLPTEVHSRVNTVFMVCYFCGGSIGSLLGAYGWGWDDWTGVCAVGLALSTLALLAHFIANPTPHESPSRALA